MAATTKRTNLERAVVRAAMEWYRWEKKTRVTPLIWPREIELSEVCKKLAAARR